MIHYTLSCTGGSHRNLSDTHHIKISITLTLYRIRTAMQKAQEHPKRCLKRLNDVTKAHLPSLQYTD